jgi:hypothetical protein
LDRQTQTLLTLPLTGTQLLAVQTHGLLLVMLRSITKTAVSTFGEPQELQQQAHLAFDHAIAKKNLQQRMESRLNVAYNSGFFTVTKEQINFLDLLGSQEVVLLDDYSIPVKVNAFELLKLMFERYHEVMNEWEEEYQQLTKIRSAKNV